MSYPYKKEVILDDGTTAVELGGTQVKRDFKNKLSAHPITQDQTGETKTLALNLNRIKKNIEVSAKLDDEVADKQNGGLDKEQVHDDVMTIFTSQKRVTLVYGDKVYKGFISQLSIDEQSKQDNSVYAYKIRLTVAEDMNVENTGGS